MTSVVRRTSALIRACGHHIYGRYQLQESNLSLEIHSKLIHINTGTFHLNS